MKLKLLIYICFVALASHVRGQSFVAQVSKNKVQVGEEFQLVFTLNTNGGNIRFPDLKDFDVYGGPNQSNNITVINGVMSQSYTFSFFLAAKKEGKLTIGPASVMITNQKVESKPIVIEVTRGAASNSNQAQTNQQEEKNQYASPIDNNDVFVRSFLNKTKCVKGEQVHLTYKLYSRYSLVDFGPKDLLNTFNGFWNQKEPPPANYRGMVETINGVNYYVLDIYSSYLFPQSSGELTIDPLEIVAIVRRQVKRAPRNFIEQFLGTNGYEDVEVKVKSKPVKIAVSDLPEQNRPADFAGAVGNFSYKAELSKQQVKANEAVNLKITLSGKGNIKLTEPPVLNLPESFETYDPKISEKINTSGGVSGSKTYDYLIIPRESGDFALNHLSFSYYDPEKKQYVSIPSPEMKLTVLPGDENSSAQVITPKHQLDERENDIRYIKTGDLRLRKDGHEFFASTLHYLLLIIPALLFAIAIYVRKRRMALNSDTITSRQRKAARMARKQLSVAEKHMKAGHKELFFDEVMAALNRYLSYKLNIPVADLSRENIQQSLVHQHITDSTLSRLTQTLDTCEYAKYAPGAVTGDLQAVYNDTVTLIANMEEEIKA